LAAAERACHVMLAGITRCDRLGRPSDLSVRATSNASSLSSVGRSAMVFHVPPSKRSRTPFGYCRFISCGERNSTSEPSESPATWPHRHPAARSNATWSNRVRGRERRAATFVDLSERRSSLAWPRYVRLSAKHQNTTLCCCGRRPCSLLCVLSYSPTSKLPRMPLAWLSGVARRRHGGRPSGKLGAWGVVSLGLVTDLLAIVVHDCFEHIDQWLRREMGILSGNISGLFP